jgi:hypothetical protein
MKLNLSIIVAAAGLAVWSCTDDPKPAELAEPADTRATGTLNVSEQTLNAGVAAGQPARVPSEGEADSLMQLQQQIMLQPENVDLRRELGQRAIDANAGVVWVVGKGRLKPNASNSNVAANQARMAATLDASRWAAYLIEWQKTDYAMNFGAIQASVPGVKVVREAVSDSLCIVLAQVPLR